MGEFYVKAVRRKFMERLKALIKWELPRRFLKLMSEYPDEVIDYIVDEEIQGRGVRARQVERVKEWVRELKAYQSQPGE